MSAEKSMLTTAGAKEKGRGREVEPGVRVAASAWLPRRYPPPCLLPTMPLSGCRPSSEKRTFYRGHLLPIIATSISSYTHTYT